MTPNYIALAIPFFFVLIAVELGVARRRGAAVYRFSDSFGDIGCGVAQQIVAIFTTVLNVTGYAYVYDHYRIYTFPSAAVAWVFAFFAVDFLYYWWHRLSHRMNFLWLAHSVHHQSEEYNLSVALRQSVLTGLTTWPFYAILAAIGIPPLILVTTIATSTLYQFWIHTRLIRTLGPLEWVLNTPSHHRGHHAVNPRYIDTNYGATLIVWDRLFGTFSKEIEEPVYGVTKPFKSFDPLWAQAAPWADLARAIRQTPRFLDKLKLVYKPPGWVPGPEGGREVPVPEISPERRERLGEPASLQRKLYVAAQSMVIVVVTFLVMLKESSMPRGLVATLGALTLLSLASLGALLDARRWAVPLELTRLGAAAAAAALWLSRAA